MQMGNFQSVLKSLRKSNNLTQEDLAKALKVSRSTIGMYENGSREPDYETLEAIADYFNVDIDYLLGRTLKTTKIIQPTTIAAHFDGDEYTDLIKKYKVLDNDGKETVDFILNKEYKRCTDYIVRETDNIKYVIETVDKEQTTDRFTKYLNAAHADDYAGAPEELKQLEENMIDKAFRPN